MTRQPDALPTNKAMAVAAVTVVMFHFSPSEAVLPPEIADAYGVLLHAALALGVAWFVPDRPQVKP